MERLSMYFSFKAKRLEEFGFASRPAKPPPPPKAARPQQVNRQQAPNPAAPTAAVEHQ